MVVTKSQSDADQGRNASAVVVERMHAAQLRDLKKILQAHVAARGPCLVYLQNLGYTVDTPVMAPSTKSNATQAREKNLAKAHAAKAAEAEALRAGGADAIPSKYSVLGALPLK
eukprot:5831802-Amphidinium_carterae.1